jgi:excinuclease ABC subunit B
MNLISMTEADYVDLPLLEDETGLSSSADLEEEILHLQKEMRGAAKKFEFEKAARLRDRIKLLKDKEMKLM